MSDLKHYGMPRRSGRYPWGSGGHGLQRGASLLREYHDLRKKGQSDADIAKGWGMKSGELRSRVSIASAEVRAADVAEANRLYDKGYSKSEIGRQMGKNESTIRNLLDPGIQERAQQTTVVANILKDAVKRHKYVDVGLGVENHLGVSRTRLKTSLQMVLDEGYDVKYFKVTQAGTGKDTSLMVLTEGDENEQARKESYSFISKNKHLIKMPTEYRVLESSRSNYGLEPIKSVDSKTIKIRYGEEGGSNKDGVIELRRGVPDLDLGRSNYAQVRIGVDGTHYLKGMAMYTDSLPPGINIIYNTNKSKGTPPEKVFKEMTKDPDNPFGAVIKMGGQRGSLNIVNEQGDWMTWAQSLSSQILSKQPVALAKQQLDLDLKIRLDDFNDLAALTQPTIKQQMLYEFGEDCDAAAVHLKAAALPRQGWHAILPFPDMKPDQIYATNYNDGEQVVLIRYPHGGTFEIPTLTVNNRQPKIEKLLGRPKDAVGIHPIVAERLSGADFDGDTVLVIPVKGNGKPIKVTSALTGLQDFNPKAYYPPYDGMKTIDGGTWSASEKKTIYPEKGPNTKAKGRRMGDVSNLITDMTIKGANESEIARAVRHSMVVIDAEKHSLNYKQSFEDNGIAALKKRYQGRTDAGAATLISRASSEERVDHVTDYYKVDPDTGKKIYTPSGKTFIDKNGKVVPRKTKTTKMAIVEDAYELSSGTRMEDTYAAYANRLKAMGNEARKLAKSIPNIEANPTARKAYEKEVERLNHALSIALSNAPLERQAQIMADSIVKTKLMENPNMDEATKKKIKGQAIQEARLRNGASKTRIEISDREWEAIQAGALSSNALSKIINNADPDRLKELATPRNKKVMTSSKIDKARAMAKSGYTQAEIAEALGVSVSLINKTLG
jgi:DNA-binding CsgD family transcriptional regulator